MEPFPAYASVILDVSIDKTLDYGILPEQLDKIKPGARVEVPLRGKTAKGFVLAVKQSPDFKNVKAIAQVVSDDVLIPQDLFELALWVARYYCCSLSRVFRVILPPAFRKGMSYKEQLFVMRAKTRDELVQACTAIRTAKPAQAAILDVMLKVTKGILLSELLEKSKGSRSTVNSLVKQGLLQIDIIRIDRSPLINEEYFQSKHKPLNGDQKAAFAKIVKSLDSNIFETHLLHGVTGSGKTEIYLQAIERALKAGKGTIMLVPEISLTSQTIERFRSRFKEKIAILHHRLSLGERHDEWQNIRSGQAKIVIGARSAIFSPVVNPGLIIVDEEHEQSYKQHDVAPCYQARDVAVMRGKLSNSTVILGSATPSLESYYNASIGKYNLSVLHKRADIATMPDVTIVDMKKEYDKAKGLTTFSEVLLNGIEKRTARGEQSILFLNRRGYHTSMICPECSKAIKCTHCDVPMTFHLNENILACHQCGFQLSPPPRECPNCKGVKPLKFRGVGQNMSKRRSMLSFPIYAL